MELLFEGSWAEIRKEMNAMLGAVDTNVLATTKEWTAGSIEVAGASTKPTPAKASKTAPSVAPVASEIGGLPATATEAPFDFKKIEEVIPKALEAAGRGKVVTLLEKYGAKKGSELKPSDYAAFYTECSALMTAASLT